MSNIWKISVALMLVICLTAAFASCIRNDDEDGDKIYVTNEAGETILDENSGSTTDEAAESQTFPIPIEDEDEDGDSWGQMVRPSNKK